MPDMLPYKVLCTPWELSRFRRNVLVPVSTTFLSDWSFSFLDFNTPAITLAALVYWEYCCCSSHKMVDSLYLPLHKMASSSLSATLQCSAHVSHLQPFKYTCFQGQYKEAVLLFCTNEQTYQRQLLYRCFRRILTVSQPSCHGYKHSSSILFTRGFHIKTYSEITWMCILTTAFPISVAPKKVPYGNQKMSTS